MKCAGSTCGRGLRESNKLLPLKPRCTPKAGLSCSFPALLVLSVSVLCVQSHRVCRGQGGDQHQILSMKILRKFLVEHNSGAYSDCPDNSLCCLCQLSCRSCLQGRKRKHSPGSGNCKSLGIYYGSSKEQGRYRAKPPSFAHVLNH